MSLFKRLAKISEKAIDRHIQEHNESLMGNNSAISKQLYRDSIDCCANCIFFDDHSRPVDCGSYFDYRYICVRNHISYSLNDLKNGEHYKKVCCEFFRK